MKGMLLERLRTRANRRGLVIVRQDVLTQELRVSVEQLHDAIGVLDREKQLRILSPLPYLVVVFPRRMLPSEAPKSSETGPDPRPELSRGHSYSFHKRNQSNAIAIEDRGAGEGGSLLEEILATLGESDPRPFHGVLQHFPVAKIRAALVRVRATPPETLRKSRTALFRYLLARSK